MLETFIHSRSQIGPFGSRVVSPPKKLAWRNRMSFHVVDHSIAQGCELGSGALELIVVHGISLSLFSIASPLMTTLVCFGL